MLLVCHPLPLPPFSLTLQPQLLLPTGVSVEGLNATIDYIVQTAPEADFAFFTGDAPWGSSVPDAMATIISSFSRLPPQQPVYFLLGNHGKEVNAGRPNQQQQYAAVTLSR